MKLHGLDHFNVRVAPQDVDQVRDFYRDIVGLVPGDRPGFSFPGYWMYLGTQPVLHIAGGGEVSVPNGTINHVAFRASGVAEVRAHLHAHGISFNEAPLPGRDMHQIFFHDPVGTRLELTFYGEGHGG